MNPLAVAQAAVEALNSVIANLNAIAQWQADISGKLERIAVALEKLSPDDLQEEAPTTPPEGDLSLSDTTQPQEPVL